MKKFEETDRMILGLNQPIYEEENDDPTRPSYYEFLTWEYWEEALIAVDRETVLGYCLIGIIGAILIYRRIKKRKYKINTEITSATYNLRKNINRSEERVLCTKRF